MSAALRGLARIAVLGVIGGFAALPLIAIVIASFVESSDLDDGLSVADQAAGLANYRNVPEEVGDLARYAVVTLAIGCVVILFVHVTSLGLAYVGNRYRSRAFGGFVMICVALGYVVPPIVLVFPYGRLLQQSPLNDSFLGLALAYCAFCLPVGVMLLMVFMRMVPIQLDATAAMDGAPWHSCLWRVLAPSLRPGIVVVSIVCGCLVWNDALFSEVLSPSGRWHTFATGVKCDVLDKDDTVLYGVLCAASVAILLPFCAVLAAWQASALRRSVPRS